MFFGYPLAHGDDAERAVRCACEIFEALKQTDTKPWAAARIGIHTSMAVIGPGETSDVGITTHLAARLKEKADADTLVISPATLKLVPGLFVTRALTPLRLKGIEKPLPVYQVLRPSGMHTRLDASESLTPFEGREEELALLLNRWERSREGRGQTCVIIAEPGFGKSRLLRVLHNRLAGTSVTWLESRCSPLAGNSAYAPVIDLLRHALAIRVGDSKQQQLQSLERSLESIGLDRQDAVPLLAPMLNLDMGSAYAPSQYGPELKRRKTQDIFIAGLLALARRQPVVLAIEDLHWADPSTLELIGYLVERMEQSPLLMLLTARPEYQSGWPHRSHVTPLMLPPLRAQETRRMLDTLASSHALSDEVAGQVVEKAGGVPLFLEEIMRSLIDSGSLHGQANIEIPSTLQDLLTSRLDNLDDAKELAQIISVIGREAPYALLTRVAARDESVLHEQLSRLEQSGLLGIRGTPPHTVLSFKHALIQEAAYQSLLDPAKQKLHGKIAASMEQISDEKSAADPAVLGSHYEKAGQAERAIHYYQLAGEMSLLRGASTESVGYLKRALEMMSSLPEGTERDRVELDLCVALGWCVVAMNGYGDSQAERAFGRARELCERINNPVMLGRALGGLFAVHQNRGMYPECLRLAQAMRVLGDRISVPLLQGAGSSLIGWTHFWMGQPVRARENLEVALQLLDQKTALEGLSFLGEDTRALCLMGLAPVLWVLGFPDQAWKTAMDSVTQAESNLHPVSIAHARTYGRSIVSLYLRQADIAMADCSSALVYVERFGFKEFADIGQLNLAVALGMQNRAEEGLEKMCGVIMQMDQRNMLAYRSFYSALQAELYLKTGQHSKAESPRVS